MTDREKLIGLLETHCAVIGEENCKAAKGEKCSTKDCANCLADHLLAHGVTVREMQKPLTVEETLEKRVVYLEFRHLVLQEPVVMFRAWNEWEDAEIIHYDRFGCQYSNIDCPESDYGKTWRCWAEKPRSEERKAAEWEK